MAGPITDATISTMATEAGVKTRTTTISNSSSSSSLAAVASWLVEEQISLDIKGLDLGMA